MAWLDYDTDGDPDIFAAGIQAPHALYRNDGDGRFADVSAAADLADPRGGWAAIAADYDGDGRPDLFATREAWEGLAPNSLYHNQGDGTFRDVAPQAGVAGTDDSFMAVWTDYDNDGLPDLYVASGITGSGRPNRLYHNQGDGTFADRGAQAGVAYRGKTLGVTCGDYDGDGDSDLYAIDVAAPNRLYRNDGQNFSDVTAEAGVAKPGEGSYVGFFIDSDGDGDRDLFRLGHELLRRHRTVAGHGAGLAPDPRLSVSQRRDDLPRYCPSAGTGALLWLNGRGLWRRGLRRSNRHLPDQRRPHNGAL